MTEPLLRVRGLTKHFPVTKGVLGKVVGQVRAVDDVSFDIFPGETLGLVGESGCGKTTVGRAVLRLSAPTAGSVVFDGTDITRLPERDLAPLRRKMQIVFQDPFSSLNPRHRVIDIVGEALEVHGLAKGEELERRVASLLSRVGIPSTWLHRYPHEFSGGQRQRIGIARAIALGPKLIVCDEAVSALDVSVQAQVLNLLVELRREMGLSYLFIAHDLSVVRHVSHRIAVMYLGQIVEIGPTERIFEAPSHPYTRALLSAIPVPDPKAPKRRLVLQGDVPTPLHPPSGCRFHTRCPAVMDRCSKGEPPAYGVEDGHTVKCFHAEGLEGDAGFHAAISERITRRMAERGVREAPLREDRTPSTAPPRSRGRAPRRTSEASRAEERRRSPRSAWALGAMALVLIALSWKPLARVRAERAARIQMRAVALELSAHATNTGSYPATLDDLGFRLYPLFERGIPNDPWHRPYVYRAPGSAGRPYDLESTGADGVPSADDLRYEVK